MVEVTLALPPGADPDSQPTRRYFPVHTIVVCVEAAPGRVVGKRADSLMVGDKLCMFGPPRPGPGVEITAVAVT